MQSKSKSRKLIGFVGGFIAALSTLAQFFPDQFALCKQIPGIGKILYICIVIVLLVLAFMYCQKSQETNDEKLAIEHEQFHRFAHLIRDTSYEMVKIGNEKNNYSSLQQILKSFSDNVVDSLYRTLCAIWELDPNENAISVCIKTLNLSAWDNEKLEEGSREDALYRTLSRNFVPKGALQKDDAIEHCISKDTAFFRIFVEGKHDWTGINLSRRIFKKRIEIVSEDEENDLASYTDSCANWKDYYSNRIVVPIRVKLSEISDLYSNTDKRNLFGFVCVEYKKTGLLNPSSKNDEDLISILDLLKTYADSMYVVYDSLFHKMNFPQDMERQ